MKDFIETVEYKVLNVLNVQDAIETLMKYGSIRVDFNLTDREALSIPANTVSIRDGSSEQDRQEIERCIRIIAEYNLIDPVNGNAPLCDEIKMYEFLCNSNELLDSDLTEDEADTLDNIITEIDEVIESAIGEHMADDHYSIEILPCYIQHGNNENVHEQVRLHHFAGVYLRHYRFIDELSNKYDVVNIL